MKDGENVLHLAPPPKSDAKEALEKALEVADTLQCVMIVAMDFDGTPRIWRNGMTEPEIQFLASGVADYAGQFWRDERD